MNNSKHKKVIKNHSNSSAMSQKTKEFLQKICYRKSASVDMTRYGFVNDYKLHPVHLLMKPLRMQLEKICDKHIPGPSRKSSIPNKTGKGPKHRQRSEPLSNLNKIKKVSGAKKNPNQTDKKKKTQQTRAYWKQNKNVLC